MAFLGLREEEAVLHDLDHSLLVAHTRHSLTDPAAFVQRLRKIREEGYVVEFNEVIEGVWGIAVPIFDARGEVVAAAGVGQSMTAHSKKRATESVGGVRACANSISVELGYRPVADACA